MLKYHQDMTEESSQTEYDAYWDWLDSIATKHDIRHAYWDAGNTDFDAVAFPSTVTTLKHTTVWGESSYTPIPPNATWLDIWKICGKIVYESEDTDHCFIERFAVVGNTVEAFLGR